MNKYSEVYLDILDRCMIEVRSGNRTISECLADYPEYKAQLEKDLVLVERFGLASNLSPRTEFRIATLARFHSAALNVGQNKSPQYPTQRDLSLPKAKSKGTATRYNRLKDSNFFGPIQKYSLVIIVSLILFVSLLSSGIVLAANNSNPGSSFYPLRYLVESTELRLSNTVIGDQQLHLRFAVRRINDIEWLVQHDRLVEINRPISSFADHLSQLESILRSDQLTDQERVFLATRILEIKLIGEDQLAVWIQDLPDTLRDKIDQALRSAQDARLSANQVADSLPEIRNQIRESLKSTFQATGMVVTVTPSPVDLAAGSNLFNTPTASDLQGIVPSPDWLNNFPTDLPDWSNFTPDMPFLATQYPSIYPTLSHLATQLPRITATPRAYLIPTRVRPLRTPIRELPTERPTLPVIPTR